MNAIYTTNTQLPHHQPIVAVLPGGTTGIGSYIADALADTFSKQGSKLRVYIIGRNAERAETVISRARKTAPGSDWRLIKITDLAYLSEADRACAEVFRQETESPLHEKPSVDVLYMTYCWPILKKRQETSEGLDSFLSTTYYSRIRFILQLLPLLTSPPQPAHIISVYAGGFEDGTKPGEFPVGLPPAAAYGVSSVRKHTCFMKTFLFEELAARHEGKLSLIHIYPGLVDGPGMRSPDLPGWFRTTYSIMKPLASLAMTKPEDCGQVMISLADNHFSPRGVGENAEGKQTARGSDGEIGGGAYAVGAKGDVANKTSMYEHVRTLETRQKVWDHTMMTIEKAIAGSK